MNDILFITQPEFILTQFSYDTLGRRISKTTYDYLNNSHTLIDSLSYVYAGEELLSQTENGTSTLFISSFQDTDDILAKVENGNISYFHKDHLGSIVAITNNSGTIVAEYSYDAFGKVKNISGDADFENTLLYTGREYDKEIGLYFYRARYYDPELGRFISQDPIGIEDDINLYAYVGNNPVNFTDPSGEKAKDIYTGATQGDYNQNANGWSTAGQIAVGFIPIVGQIADFRDFTYQWKHGTRTDVVFAGIGFIPIVGDAIKLGRKGHKTADNLKWQDFEEEAAQRLKDAEEKYPETIGTLNQAGKKDETSQPTQVNKSTPKNTTPKNTTPKTPSPNKPKSGDDLPAKSGGKDGGGISTKQSLMDELFKQNIRFTPSAVKNIKKIERNDTGDIKIFWLEKGDDRRGYQHIFEDKRGGGLSRFEELVKGGTVKTEKELLDLMYDIIQTGRKEVNLEDGIEKWIFIKKINEKNVGVATGSNGFIVTITYK